jgi:hypothetical protein
MNRFEVLEYQFNNFNESVDKNAVDVVVNQKVVSVDAQEVFTSKGILIFERLGLNGIRRISKMSNIKMILQNLSQKFEPEDLIGTLDDLKHLVQFRQPFLLFLKH